nr:retrovirus-related Pol polyprotein from transposon TNT 1-94 [Tanacetum cinerariifolium]
MKAEDWTLLVRQALGVIRLSLAKNVAYNVVNEKNTYGLIKALSNMYDKHSASNKVFLIQQLVNTKTKEGASIADYVNEFNSILSRLMYVDIKFYDEVQVLLLHSSLPESWSGTVTIVSGSTRNIKLKFDNIHDLIIEEDICRKTSKEYSNSLISAGSKSRHRAEARSKTECSKPEASKDKEVHMAVSDCDDALIGEEGYHIGFEGQQWKVTRGSLVVACGNKHGSMYMVEVTSNGINTAIDDRGNATLWHQRLGYMSEKGMKVLASKGRIPDSQKAVVGFCEPCVLGKQKKVDPATMLPLSMIAAGRIRMLKTVLETTQHNGVAERMNQTLNDRSKKPKWELRYGKESKNSKSFKDSGRLYEEDFEDEASSDEGGSETPHVPRSSKESRALDGRKRYKAQLVVNGFQQKRGVDYYEIFSPVVKMTTIRLVLSVIASGYLHLKQLDVKTTILHGDLDEDIYMAQPEGFQSAGKEENLICKLKKTLYGLKQDRDNEAKPTGMKDEDWTLLVRQALGVDMLSLAKNVPYNVVNEKTTHGLIKALSNMYDKHSASNKGSKSRHREEARSKTECSKPVASKDKEVYMAVSDYDDALVCCIENMIEDHIMDSSASFHATFFKEELESFRLRSSKVRLTDDKTQDIAGVGDVILKTSFGFEGQQWKVTRGSLVVACGNKHGSMYMVEVTSNRINAAIDDRGNATLWHQRLRYMSEKGMKVLASKGRIPDSQKAVVGFCEPCVLGKQKKVSFVKFRNTRKLQRLELVHADVYGPKSVSLIGGSRYYVTFINDSNRKVWVHFLKNKSEVSNTFKMWKVAVENETNLRVKCLKIDNGGEYSSRYFIKYCTENRIRMLKTVLETTQHNEPKWELRYGKESKNQKSFKDSGRSYEEDFEDEASSDEGGSETPHVPRSSKESKALDGRKRYKAQLVVNGFQQKQGVDYYKIFSPVVKMTTIRLVLSVIASGDLHLEQLDVKTTILHGDLDEDIYMAQPEGFQSAGKEENLICKLKKILYGLKQAPRQ